MRCCTKNEKVDYGTVMLQFDTNRLKPGTVTVARDTSVLLQKHLTGLHLTDSEKQ